MHILGIADFWTYLIGAALIIALPGPNVLYVFSVGAQSGVRDAYRAVRGIVLGDAILMTLSAAGMASLLRAHPKVFFVIKYAGAAYLFYFGLNILRAAWHRMCTAPDSASEDEAESAPYLQGCATVKRVHRPFRDALLISLCNPKAILFFISFFIQFVDPQYPHPALSFMTLGVINQLLSISYMSVLIFAGTRLAKLFQHRRYLSASASAGAGALLVGFGLKLATTTLN